MATNLLTIIEPDATSAPRAYTNPVVGTILGEDPLVEWLLPDFIARGSLLVWAGEPGAGKSFACYVLGLACAANVPVLGFQVAQPLRVLYFDQENSQPDRNQYIRWAWHGLTGQPDIEHIETNFRHEPFALGTPDWFVMAQRVIEAFRPDLIIFDTATPCFAIEDENDNGIATKTINKLRALQGLITPTPAMIVLKHAKIVEVESIEGAAEGRRTIRGAKAWAGMCDAIVFHVRAVGRPRADGLARTSLIPAKTRAFGLRQPIQIHPSWVGTDPRRGLQLSRGEAETTP